MEPDEKAALQDKASKLGVSTGELLRLAAERFDEDVSEAELEALARELEAAVPKMKASFDAIERSLAESRSAIREALDHFEGKKA
jgi:hypothetical protein